ncbi:Transcription factor 25 [Geranomyces michiganensis]|nr:Transcription factor 25 [Geranomyces michiganensis]
MRERQAQPLAPSDSDSGVESDVDTPPPVNSMFSLLGADDEEVGSDNDVEARLVETEPEAEEPPAPVRPPTTSSKKKKKKKSKAGGVAAAGVGGEDEGAKTKGKKLSSKDDDLDEIDRTLKELNEKYGEVSAATQEKNVTVNVKSLLSVDPRALDADAEMRKMFGSRVVNDEIRRKKYIRSGKRTALAAPREHWAKPERLGLSMELLDTTNSGVSHFAFVHARAYQEIQRGYLECVRTHDPNTIQNLLRMYPYHIDALLQWSEIVKHSGDISLASELIETALFALERSFHSQFNIATGLCRLSYMHFENRCFHIAIFRHIGYLARRGCWRTAFEFSKLLMSLDPEDDPVGTLYSIDFYAINAREFEWYTQFWEGNGKQYNLATKPNHAFNIALASWELETSKHEDHTESSKKLQQAIVHFPATIPLVYEKLGTSSAGVSADAPFFSGAEDSQYLSLSIQLFVERNHALWKVPEVLAWLRENVAAVVARLPLPVSANDTLASKIKTEYQKGVPRVLSRHIFISDFNSITSALPAEVTASGIQAHDPLPPPDAPPSPYAEFEQQHDQRGDPAGFLSNMLQHMLPWINRGGAAGGAPRARPPRGADEPDGDDEVDDEGLEGEGGEARDMWDLEDLAEGVLNPRNEFVDGEGGGDEQVAATIRAMQESLPGLFPAGDGGDGTGGAPNPDFLAGLRDTFARLGLFSAWGPQQPQNAEGGNNEGTETGAVAHPAPPSHDSGDEA